MKARRRRRHAPAVTDALIASPCVACRVSCVVCRVCPPSPSSSSPRASLLLSHFHPLASPCVVCRTGSFASSASRATRIEKRSETPTPKAVRAVKRSVRPSTHAHSCGEEVGSSVTHAHSCGEEVGSSVTHAVRREKRGVERVAQDGRPSTRDQTHLHICRSRDREM